MAIGRKKFEPTPEQRATVKAMVACGTPQDKICLVIINPTSKRPISEQTLRTTFRQEIDSGAVVANAKVAKSLYDQATGGNVAAAIFWLKCRCGWKETQVMEHQGKDGGPMEHRVLSGLNHFYGDDETDTKPGAPGLLAGESEE